MAEAALNGRQGTRIATNLQAVTARLRVDLAPLSSLIVALLLFERQSLSPVRADLRILAVETLDEVAAGPVETVLLPAPTGEQAIRNPIVGDVTNDRAGRLESGDLVQHQGGRIKRTQGCPRRGVNVVHRQKARRRERLVIKQFAVIRGYRPEMLVPGNLQQVSTVRPPATVNGHKPTTLGDDTSDATTGQNTRSGSRVGDGRQTKSLQRRRLMTSESQCPFDQPPNP